MERSLAEFGTAQEAGDVPFNAEDRIGQLHLRNLDITDTHEKLLVYSSSRLLNLGGNERLFFLPEDTKGTEPPATSD